MKSLGRKFLKLLLVEIEDLKEDLDLFVLVAERRRREHQITDYVYNENLSILHNELLGIKECVHECEELFLREGAGVEEIRAEVKERLRNRLQSRGYVAALYRLLEARVDRIADYLRGETNPELPAEKTAPLGDR